MTYQYKKYLTLGLKLTLFIIILLFVNIESYKIKRLASHFISHTITQKIPLIFTKQTKIKWENISVSWIPLRVTITKTKITIPNNKLFSAPIKIHKIIISPHYFSLLYRKLFMDITVISPKISIVESNTKTQKIDIKKYISINFIKNIPISNVNFKNTYLLFTNSNTKVVSKKLNIYVNINSYKSKIQIKINTPYLKIKSLPKFASNIDILIKPNYIKFIKFDIKNKNSWVNISAQLKKSKKIHYNNLLVNGDFFVKDIMAFVHLIYPHFTIPFKGKITLNTKLSYSTLLKLNGNINLLAKNFYFKNIFIPQVKIKGIIKKQKLLFKKFTLSYPNKWSIYFTKAFINLKKTYPFKTTVIIKGSKFKSLLKSLKLEQISIHSLLNGKGHCQGEFFINTNIQCDVAADFNNFTLYGSKDWIVLDIPKLKTTSSMYFKNKIFTSTTHIVSGKTRVNIDSQFSDQGMFLSQYKGVIHLNDITDFVYLQPKGIINILDGSIAISPHKTIVKSRLHFKQLVLNKFRLGDINTQLNYKESGILKFRKIKGKLKQSKYTGKININIPKDTIQIFAHFPYITLENLKYALKDSFDLPFTIKGAGTLSGYLNSPLQEDALNYDIESQFTNITFKKEYFNKAIIQFKSKNGFVKSKKIEFTKNKSNIIVKGTITPKGQINTKIKGSNIQIKTSENISQFISNNISGLMNFNMSVNGDFFNPVAKAIVLIKKSFYKENYLGNSHINLNIKKHQIELHNSVLFNKINIKKLIFPYKKHKPVKIIATVNNLNKKISNKAPSTILPNPFESNINSTIHLMYKKNQFATSATGNIKIDKFTLHANNYFLTNKSPFAIKLKKGNINIDPILLQSKKNSLSIVQNTLKKISINGDLKLDFLFFMFPFIKILEGDLKVDVNLNTQLSYLNPKGTIKLTKGFIKLNSDLDPFEDIQSDLIINNNTFNFASLYTKIGEGNLIGKGSINRLKNFTTIVNMKGKFFNIKFNPIAGIYTKSSGNIFLTGNKFPYTLGITASLEDSYIKKEFASHNNNQLQIDPKLFLLKGHKKNYEFIQMRFNLYFKNPLQIENSTIKASFLGGFKVTGFPSQPLLHGTLNASPGGTIIFRDHEFKILSSKIMYLNNPPSNPTIRLSAKTVVHEENINNDFSNEFNIMLKAKGKVQNPKFTLTSTPSIHENEIMSLLTLGTRSIKLEQKKINNIAKYSYYHLGPVLFQQAIGKELKNAIGVDQFLIVPHVSSKNSSTSTKLILRKQVFKRLNLSASQTILDNHPERDIKVEYKINKNVSVIGLWQNKEPAENIDTNTKTTGSIGLDWEYQIDF